MQTELVYTASDVHPSKTALARPDWQTFLPIGAICLIVLAFWLPFGFKTSGLVEEWDVLGLLATGHQLFWVDQNSALAPHAIRPFTVLPHAIAYALDPTSFVWFNIQQMLFFMGKGIFAFLLLRRLLRGEAIFAFLVAVLFVIHPADTGLFTFRAIHIHMAVMFYLMAAYLLLVYCDTRSPVILLLMWGALAMTLLSYEVTYPLVAITPLLLLSRVRRISRPLIITAALWYLIPLLTGLRVIAILTSISRIYQTQVINSSTGGLDWGEILYATGLVYARSLVTSWTELAAILNPGRADLLLAAGVVALALIAGVALRQARLRLPALAWLIVIGLVLIIVGFLPYLLVPTHRFLTLRTYYLPSLGAAMVLGSVVYLLTLRRRVLFAAVMCVFIGVAALSALNQQRHYLDLALRQQRFMGQILAQAPALTEKTGIVILDRTGALNEEWFFGTRYNFSLMIRYLYDDITIKAAICRTANTAFGWCDYSARRVTYHVIPTGIVPVAYDDAVFFEYSYDGEVRLLDDITGLVPPGSEAFYQPETRIIPNPRPPMGESMFQCWPIEGCTVPPAEYLPAAPFRTEFSADTFAGPGWQGREFTPDDRDFRWLLANEGQVFARLESGQAYTLALSVLYTMTPDGPDGVELMVNDTPLDATWAVEDGSYVYRAIIPRTAVDAPVDTIRIIVDELGIVEGTDVALGVAADWLSIAPAPTQTSARVEFDGVATGTGWRGSETTPDGMTFQWSVAESAEVDLGLLAENDYQLEARVMYVLEPNTVEEIALSVGDTPLDLTYRADESGQTIIRATLPRDLVASQSANVLLTVSVPELVVPSEGETLGVALDWVTVEPLEAR